MKKSFTLRSLSLIPVAALLLSLFSFSARPGGEGFEVFQNDKLILQQFGNDMKKIRTIQLGNISSSDEITVKYYHCGQTGKNRHLIIRDSDNKELKHWQFADMSSKDRGMSFHPADVLISKGKKAAATVNVYYTSTEIPQGRHLMTLQLNS